MKRKAEPLPLPVDATAPLDPTYEPQGLKAAGLANRRESARQIKRPKKDLPDDQAQHSTKNKKGPLTEQLKYCNAIIKELFNKKHGVSNIAPQEHITIFAFNCSKYTSQVNGHRVFPSPEPDWIQIHNLPYRSLVPYTIGHGASPWEQSDIHVKHLIYTCKGNFSSNVKKKFSSI